EAPPDTTIVTGPQGVTTSRVASFTYFTQPREGAYECRLDQNGVVGQWSQCWSSGVTYGGLTDGQYDFWVEGSDGVQTDPTPAERSFSITSTGPDVSLTGHPSNHQQG